MKKTAANTIEAGSCGYASAIAALNQLQTGPASRAARPTPSELDRAAELAQLSSLAAAVGLDQKSLSSLRLIHIAGTKGKGSVAAFTERLLRSSGLRTGFFSSPHLVEVRERIRLDGRPVSQAEFASQFWRLHADLTAATGAAESGLEFPRYFRFLTFMALRLFVEHRVDVAIVEVGIGGRYDSTNFVQWPWLCGVTSLGHDHTALLGNTLAEIAWHKAGILKHGCLAVTSPDQPAECLPVLAREAAAVGCPIRAAPRLTSLPGFERLRLDGYQLLNAALSLQLARLWLRRLRDSGIDAADVLAKLAPGVSDVIESVTDNDVMPPAANSTATNAEIASNEVASVIKPSFTSSCESTTLTVAELTPFTLPDLFVEAIRDTRWPGRCTIITQTVPLNDSSKSCTITYYIDGAHTIESCPLAGRWFLQNSQASFRVLIFNRTGDRDPGQLISSLLDGSRLTFSAGLFCPNLVDCESASHPELANLMVAPGAAAAAAQQNAQAFSNLAESHSETVQLACVRDAVDWIRRVGSSRQLSSVDVLATGSLHLVGCLLAVLQPAIADNCD